MDFPTYPDHRMVFCFQCGFHLPVGQPKVSDFGRGNGQFYAFCGRCKMHTWYDVGSKPPPPVKETTT